MKSAALQLGFGVAFGFVLSKTGFSDWTELQRMFRFEAFNLLTAFVIAVVLLAPLWFLLKRGGLSTPRRPVHPGTVPGGILFGAGWAIAGACPAGVMVQLGEGKMLALCTLLGVVLGNYGYGLAHSHWASWDVTHCADD